MKFCCYPKCSYIKVIIMGIISTAIIYGVYSYLMNIEAVQIDNSYTDTKGISCSPKSSYNASYNVCTADERRMANISSVYSELNCSAHTQYPTKSIFDTVSLE
eukprot:381543_1